MIYRRGTRGTWWYRFRFGAGRMVHESAKTTSKTVAAERQRRARARAKVQQDRKAHASAPIRAGGYGVA